MPVAYDPEKHGETIIPLEIPPQKGYDPEKHGELIENTPPQISDEAVYQVDYDFLQRMEGFETSGYVPQKNGEVLGKSGVTIASGLDLGQWDKDKLVDMGMRQELADKFDNYYGKKKADAVSYLKENPLSVSEDEATEINNVVKPYFARKVAERLERDFGVDMEFIPAEIQTAITSVLFQYGINKPEKNLPKFFSAIKNKDWGALEAELRNFGDKYSTRRNHEADLVKQYLDTQVQVEGSENTTQLDTEKNDEVAEGFRPEPVQDGWYDVDGTMVRFTNGQPEVSPQMSDAESPVAKWLRSFGETETPSGNTSDEDYIPGYDEYKFIRNQVLSIFTDPAASGIDAFQNVTAGEELRMPTLKERQDMMAAALTLADLGGVRTFGKEGMQIIADAARVRPKVGEMLKKKASRSDMNPKSAKELEDFKEKVYKEAGVWQNPVDGSVRIEIHPDGYVTKHNQISFEPKPIDEIFSGSDFEQLKQIYPELAEVKVKFSPMGTPTNKRGAYNTETKTIQVNGSLSTEEIRSTLHHELQHALQQADEVIGGAAMPKDAKNLPRADYLSARLEYLSNQGEVEARAVQEALKGNTKVHPLLRDNLGGVVTGDGKKVKL